MLLNKHNVEYCPSLDIGYDNDGHALKLRIDKLTFVSRLTSDKEKAVYEQLELIASKQWKSYRVQWHYAKCKEGEKVKPYRKALMVWGKAARSPMLLRIDYDPINRNTGGIRFDLRPQHLEAAELNHLFAWLGKQIGEFFPRLLARAWITQVDVALDIYGCQLDDYIWGLHRASKTKHYDIRDGLPGVRIGSVHSPLHVLCYEKVDAVGQTKRIFKCEGDLLELALDQYPRFLRVEMRFKPLAKPTHTIGKALMLANLKRMKNPFERLQVYSKSLEQILLMEKLIRTRRKWKTYLAYLRQINRNQKTVRIAKKIDVLIKESEIVLFDKQAVWKYWEACVARLGSKMIPLEAELPKKKRNSF